MTISGFSHSDLNKLEDLQPDGWPSIIPYWHFYLDSGYCEPIKISNGGQMIGIGTTIYHEDTVWLAHIIVHKEHRNQGLGYKITEALLNSINIQKYPTVLLIATAQGAPIYAKLGFIIDQDYTFYKKEPRADSNLSSNPLIVDYENSYQEGLLQLDLELSGERRQKLLLPHLKQSKLILEHGKVLGFYLPTLGEGLILAKSTEVGVQLMTYKHEKVDTAVIPSDNIAATEFLISQNFKQVRTAPRMYLGKPLNWQSQAMFGRIGGNLG